MPTFAKCFSTQQFMRTASISCFYIMLKSCTCRYFVVPLRTDDCGMRNRARLAIDICRTLS